MLRQCSVLLTVWELLLVNLDTKLDISGRGTLNRGTASIRLIFGHVYGGISLIIDWRLSPLWVLPPPGKELLLEKRKVADRENGSKSVSGFPPCFLSYSCPSYLQWLILLEHVNLIHKPLSLQVLLVMVFVRATENKLKHLATYFFFGENVMGRLIAPGILDKEKYMEKSKKKAESFQKSPLKSFLVLYVYLLPE